MLSGNNNSAPEGAGATKPANSSSVTPWRLARLHAATSCRPLPWAAPGLFGGLIAGGLIAGALAPRYYGGYYGYGYPAYYGGYYDGPSCWRRHFNGWRWVAYRVC